MRLTDALVDPVGAEVAARLDARLGGSERPVALALSGGGDSVALMHMAQAWARARGRRVVAMTLDHELNPDSGGWTEQAGAAARALGLEWRSQKWMGVKPTTGLAAAARRARHSLLAHAAREVGASVLLMGHTADDIAEADWMRARGSTLGRLREWGPSPVWPEGRDVMLLRPLLGVRRAALRGWLTARGVGWMDDPANADPSQARARARRALAGRGDAKARPAPVGVRNEASEVEAHAGVLRLPRAADTASLAAAAVCAGGGADTPRGDRLAALRFRLSGEQQVIATLSGARIAMDGDAVMICRAAGRNGLPTIELEAGVPSVWDGRYEIVTDRAGLSVAPLGGRGAMLSEADRAWARSLPAAVRPCLPVLIGDGLERPVLAGRAARVRCLVPGRYSRAVGGTSQASDLEAPTLGEMASGSLSR